MLTLFFATLALASGALLPVAAGSNAQLARSVGSPFTATAFSLALAALTLLATAALTGSVGALAALPGVVWWHAAGGAASAFYVVATILLFPRIGAVASVGLFVAGQTAASLALDEFGFLGVPVRAISAWTTAGAVAVLLGSALIVRGQSGGLAGLRAGVGWIAFALLAGAGLPIQGAVNGLLRQDLGAPFAVGVVSFTVATIAMTGLVLATLSVSRAAAPCLSCIADMPWWGWLGGLVGAAYVTTMFTAIPMIGAAPTVGLTVAGQQLAALIVDRYGLLRLPRRPISAMRLVGVALLVLGVAAMGWR